MSYIDEKLKWCRENVPASISGVDDDTLLKLMGNAYEKMLKLDTEETDMSNENKSPMEANKIYVKNQENEMFDYIVSIISSEFGDGVAFKGGYMLTKMIPYGARQTVDVDLSTADGSMYGSIKNTLCNIAEHFIEEDLIISYEIKETIAPTMSGGIKMYRKDGTYVGVDVGWHDISWGTATINLDIGEVNAFTIERMLSDKIVASCTKKRFRRVKDIYDIYAISDCLEFDASVIALNILSRTEGAGADWNHLPFNDVVLKELCKAYDRLNVKSIFVGEKIQKPSFKSIMRRYTVVTNKVHYLLGNTHWNPDLETFD